MPIRMNTERSTPRHIAVKMLKDEEKVGMQRGGRDSGRLGEAQGLSQQWRPGSSERARKVLREACVLGSCLSKQEHQRVNKDWENALLAGPPSEK